MKIFFYYARDKESGWQLALSEHREKTIADVAPKYVTVLDLDTRVEDEFSAEDYAKIGYRGPFYADWDCSTIHEGVESVCRWLEIMEQEYGVDPRMIRLYATGGRGFHAEVPLEIFVAENGRTRVYRNLPHVWKELANITYTEFLDLKVYSAKRGRMWRTPNVERETAGKYKVPISYTELLTLRDAGVDACAPIYDALCSAPRPWPELVPPVLNLDLASWFEATRAKIEQHMKKGKTDKESDQALKSFKGEWPEAVRDLMAGRNLSPDVGLNKIALQLAIISTGLGKTLEQHLDACEGLIQNYRGDGHPSARSVRNELRRIFAYIEGNPTFKFSMGGIRSISEDQGQFDTDIQADLIHHSSGHTLRDLTGGLLVGPNGLYRSPKPDTPPIRVTNFHFDPDSVEQVMDAETGESQGFSIISKLQGVPSKELLVDATAFASGDRARSFLSAQGAILPEMDSRQAAGLMALITGAALQSSPILTVPKEGINLVKNGSNTRLVWGSPYGCVAATDEQRYRLRSESGSRDGNYRSDVYVAPEVTPEKMFDFIDALLNINRNKFTLACVLGWLSACWMKPLLFDRYQQFPLLQISGESGSGKTATMIRLMRMFYYRSRPVMIMATDGTQYGRRVLFTGSTSIPLYLDEYKESAMNEDMRRRMFLLMHEVYTSAFQTPRGGGDIHSGRNEWNELRYETKTTPLVFSTEVRLNDTALVERTVTAVFDKSYRVGCDGAFQQFDRGIDTLSFIGRNMLNAVLTKSETLMELFEGAQATAKEHLGRAGNDRITYNAGIVLGGVAMLQKVIRASLPREHRATFDDRFGDQFDDMYAAVKNPASWPNITSTPEIMRILASMAASSHLEYSAVQATKHYELTRDYLDICLELFYDAYRQHTSRRGDRPMFPNVEGFRNALAVGRAFVAINPNDTTLPCGTNGLTVIRLSLQVLQEFGVPDFNCDLP
jgi:hypothetical protein